MKYYINKHELGGSIVWGDTDEATVPDQSKKKKKQKTKQNKTKQNKT